MSAVTSWHLEQGHPSRTCAGSGLSIGRLLGETVREGVIGAA